MTRLFVLAAATAVLAAAPAYAQSPAPAQPAAAPAPVAPAKEQALLTRTMDAMVAGAPNYADMEPALADAVRAQAAAMAALWRQLGARQSIVYAGEQNGLHRFDTTYANGKLAWIIGLTPEGKIHTLAAQPIP